MDIDDLSSWMNLKTEPATQAEQHFEVNDLSA